LPADHLTEAKYNYNQTTTDKTKHQQLMKTANISKTTPNETKA